jgi:hypothetical protein
MSASDQDNRQRAPSVLDEDFGEDLNPDLELERVIRHLDEATAESPSTLAGPAPEPVPEPKKPQPLTARAAVPVKDPPASPKGSDTVLLTERLAPPEAPVAPTVPARPGSSVIDLVDEIDDPFDDPDLLGPPAPVKTVADLTAKELGDLISEAVERGLRAYFAR